MTKITFALAAALLAGTTMTNAANAGGVRLGFGFPLGAFIAHQALSSGGYDRHSDRPRYSERRIQAAEAARLRKAKAKSEVAAAAKMAEVKTAKLEDKLPTSESTTTEIAKTSTDTATTADTTAETTASTETTSTSETSTETAKSEKVAAVAKPETEKTATASNAKQTCRRYSAAIAGLIDVPCEQ
jgi:hypothetical protein